MKKKSFVGMLALSLILLGACTKNPSEAPVEQSQASTQISEAMVSEPEESEEMPALEKKQSAIDQEQFLLDNVWDLTEQTTGGAESNEFTIGFVTDATYEEAKSYYQELVKALAVEGITEIGNDSEESWSLIGTYDGGMTLQITIGPQEDNQYIMILSY
ncbi:hypothetical protein ACYSNO_06605 [Enterococcus sp. LJL98]